MTLGDGKRKVLMIIDEYSAGGVLTVDDDIDLKMNDFFDMAQKDMISVKPIIKETEITLGEGTISGGMRQYSLPANFKSYFRIWKDGRLTKLYPVRQDKLCASEDETGTLLVEYFAFPQTIGPDTADSYEFEVSEDAANCLPFYVAAQQLISDLVMDYAAVWNIYLQQRALLDTSLPSGGSTGIRQSLFRG